MPPPVDDGVLTGCSVVATRPAGSNAGLAALLNSSGATVFECPLLNIVACQMPAPVWHEPPRWLIFTSRNAVEHAFVQWPELTGKAAESGFCAVGAGTAKALNSRGVATVLLPQNRYSSEGLLALAEFQHPAGQRLIIVSGQGGRMLLEDTLRARGARVECVEVYRRVSAGKDVSTLLARQGGEIHMFVITSTEALGVYGSCLRERGQACGMEYPLVVASSRIATEARRLGLSSVIEVAEQVSDESLACACRRLWQHIRQ